MIEQQHLAVSSEDDCGAADARQGIEQGDAVCLGLGQLEGFGTRRGGLKVSEQSAKTKVFT